MRYSSLDFLRWLAVIGMIFFHANYLFENVFFRDVLPFSDNFWFFLGRGVAVMFITIAWVSWFLSDTRWFQIHWFIKRTLTLGVIALLISFITFLFIPEQRILWWIIHFFTLISLISPFFRYIAKYTLYIWVATLLIGYYFPIILPEIFLFIPFGWIPNNFYSADYYPLIPWVGYYLIGYGFARYLWDRLSLDILKWNIPRSLYWMVIVGKNVLLVYTLHVPVIYILLRLLY